MPTRAELRRYSFRLSDESWIAFGDYLKARHGNIDDYDYFSYNRLIIIREIIEKHARMMINIFSKKNNIEVKYDPYLIASKENIASDFIGEFFERLVLSPAGAELFIEELRQDLILQAERFGKEGENGLIYHFESSLVFAACYDKPEIAFAEKYKLGKGMPICESLRSRIRTFEMLKRGY